MSARDPSAPPIGWPLLPLPDSAGRLHWPTLAQSVRDNIEVLLRTRPGEQLMRPNFGGGLPDFLAQPNTITTHRRINDAVAAVLTQYEPRILLDRIEVEQVEGEPVQVRIELAYRLRRTGVAHQLGMTLLLEG